MLHDRVSLPPGAFPQDRGFEIHAQRFASAAESFPKPQQRGLSSRQPRCPQIPFHISQDARSRFHKAGGLGDIARMISVQGSVLVLGCPFPLFNAEALKPAFLNERVVGLPSRMRDRKPKL